MSLKSIFTVFSKRPEAAKAKPEIPSSTRNRVLMWVLELYSNSRTDAATMGKGDFNAQFWQEIHARLEMRTGRFQLSDADQWSGSEAWRYVYTCSGEEFLDFLEDIFRVDTFFQVSIGDDDKLVDELNFLLQRDKLPYHLTRFMKETVTETGRSGGTH